MSSTSPLFRQWLLLRRIAAANGEATIKWLSRELAVSEKTVRRDVETLREVGFPLAESTGSFGRKTYALPGTDVGQLSFTYDEALALFFCGQAISVWEGTFFAEAAARGFAKIRANLGAQAVAYVERILPRYVPTGLAGRYEDKAGILNELTLGIEESRAVSITYHSSRSTEPVTYDVHPYGIVDHRGSLYLVGFSPQHDAIRHWKLDRVDSAELTRISFQRPAHFDLRQHLAASIGVFQGVGAARVQIRVSPAASRYVEEKRVHVSQQVTRQPDGSAVVELTVAPTPELRSWILSFGSAAEVLEPESLRSEITEEVQRLAQMYARSSMRKARPAGVRGQDPHQG